MLRSSLTALIFALLFGAGTALAATGNDSPNDPNNGKGNDGSTHEGPGTGGGHPGGSGPGQSLLDDGPFMIAGDNVAPGSGNWGGGPGNSGSGDKNGVNDKSKDGGQTPNDDK